MVVQNSETVESSATRYLTAKLSIYFPDFRVADHTLTETETRRVRTCKTVNERVGLKSTVCFSVVANALNPDFIERNTLTFYM
jgi:hypothetical protein